MCNRTYTVLPLPACNAFSVADAGRDDPPKLNTERLIIPASGRFMGWGGLFPSNYRDMDLRGQKTVKARRELLEKGLRIKLPNIGTFSLDEAVASSRNCENMIGAAQIPIGIAGPLKVNGENFYIPLATTEGALVASVSRGCKAITESRGAISIVEKIGATRGPVFKTKGIAESLKLKSWLEKHFKELAGESKKTSPHIKLLKFDSVIAGNYLYVRFYFDTDEAMGMNMVTIATEKMTKYMEKKTGIKYHSLSGNYCIDKKASWLNFINGRGYKVNSEILLREKVIKKVLKTTAKKIYDVWLSKCMIGSALSGSTGFNAQFANVVASFFIATGQDPAHVSEGSIGITTAEIKDGDLNMNVYLPDLMLGTVGGGTGLGTQSEALSILGTGKNTKKMASILGGAVLAGEISLLASLSEQSLVTAHNRLGRGRK